ncbi:competence protein ComK [Sporosarcina sp. CAU 1771]
MDNKKMISEFQITFDTLVLQPISQDGTDSTFVIESQQEFILPQKPLHMIKKFCAIFSGSYDNAMLMTTQVVGKFHKLPVVVTHFNGFPNIFLPTMSGTSKDNVWIALNAIDRFSSHEMGCELLLSNGRSLIVNASPATIQRQYTLGTLLGKDFRNKQLKMVKSSNHYYNQHDDIKN